MRTIGYIVLFLLTFGVGGYSMRYLDFQIKDVLLNKEALWGNWVYLTGFYTHVGFGIVALLLGSFQFVKSWRDRYLNAHRWMGKVYVWAVLLSGIAGLYIAQYAMGGSIATLGFSVLGIAWLWTTFMAYRTILQKQVVLHQKWMLRSYALTLAAVTLRLWLGVFLGLLGLEFIESYVIISWLSWVPNLIVVEWWIWRYVK